VHEVPAPFVRDLQASLRRDAISLLLAAQQGAVSARALQDAKDETGRVLHALELSGQGLEPVILYIDPSTGLIAKQTYVAAGPDQPLIEEIFSDYRPVDGVQVAYVATVRRGGQTMLERHVDVITINPPLDRALFTRPAP
jgi:hypothetical protein